MKSPKSVLPIIALIAIVNALGYGIIIPILYSYSQKFGLTDFQNGLLFAIFSIFQFIATPIIGRLSDKYGRKPLLIISIAGTAISFLLMAFAPSAAWLFLARALDGITAGNIPVASAVISDTMEPKERAKGFGIIGASFGFGFIFGPAISALTLHFGDTVPFLISAAVAGFAVLLTAFVLPETNMHRGKEVIKAKLFDFKKLMLSVTDEHVGLTLIVSFLYSFAFALFIYAYQPFSVKVLHLSATQISLNFTIIGVMGLITQALLIPRLIKKIGDKRMLTGALFCMIFTLLAFFFVRTEIAFMGVSILNGLANAFVGPMIQTLLSKEADNKSQGQILGLNASYVSLGMIFGPIIGGALATASIPMPFLVGSGITFLCLLLSTIILKKPLSPQAQVHAMS